MKLTKDRLKQIIKEELEEMMGGNPPQSMSGAEMQKVFQKAIDSGNSKGVQQLLNKLDPQNRYMALNDVFNKNVMIVYQDAYNAEIGAGLRGKDLYDRLRANATALVPYDVANVLTSNGLKIQ